MRLPPSILWGIDPPARLIAGRLLEFKGIDDSQRSRMRPFEPSAEWAREIRRTLAVQQEAGNEPEIAILASAFAPEAQAIADLLRGASEVLETSLQGSQSILLVVFLPPPIATDEEKVRTWEFFVSLEALAGTLPFLNAIFVNPLPDSVYEGADPDDLFCEILVRELRDEDLQDLIRGKGFASARNPLKAGGRSCCYSTAGYLRLIYQGAETLAYLRARFSHAMFDDGFVNPAAVTDSEEKLIGQGVEGLFASQALCWGSRLPKPGQVTADIFSRPLDPKNKAQAITALEHEFERALRPEVARFEQDLSLAAVAVRDAFRAYFEDSPKLIAGASRFLDVLTAETTGIGGFEQTFGRLPLMEHVDQKLGPLLAGTLAGAEVNVPPPRKQEETGYEWLKRAVDSLASAARAAEPGPASPFRFFCQAFEGLDRYLTEKTGSADRARELLREMLENFAEESGALFPVADELRTKQECVAEQLQKLPETHAWVRRVVTRRGEFRKERARLLRELAEIETRQRNLDRNVEGMREILRTVVNQIILPHMPRVRVTERLRQQAWELKNEFANFTQSVKTQLAKNWANAPSGMETRGAAERSALTDARRELLYQRLANQKSMIFHALAALRFNGPSQETSAKPSYSECRTLYDHARTGSRPLLDRIDDYTASLLAAFEKMDILDIIELGGKEKAAEYLSNQAAQADRCLEFASGLMPLVASALHSVFALKVLGGPNSLLAAEHASAFQPERTFIDCGRRFGIEIVSLKFGFPAFLIQGLNEARRLARTAAAGITADLWPESTAEVGHVP